MPKWRVGTLSLGMLLVALGIVIFVSQIKQYQVLDALLTWWPIVLIIIGGEVLWHIYTAKDQSTPIKYDIFSMFLIGVVIFFSICWYAFTSTGVLELASRAVSAMDFNMEIPVNSVEIGAEIEEIIIQAPREELNIDTSSGPKVVFFGTARVNAMDYQEAEGIVNQGRLITHQEGDKLFISIGSIPHSRDLKPGATEVHYTLLLPEDMMIRIESSEYYNIQIAPAAADDIRLVDGRGNINIIVAKETDLIIESRISLESQLGGNVQWEIKAEELENYPEQSSVTGTLQWGAGSKLLTILGADSIQVNEI